ncbi:MAG: hypothetical protein ACJ8BW_07425 [Ktedonobacteraceae bacterium]|jgi:hypothetical protein
MNSPIVTNSTDWMSSTSDYTVFQPASAGSIPFGPIHKSFSSWKKFIRPSTQQSGSEAATTINIVATERTTAEGPIVFKPTPTLEELLNGPLSQVVGMFAIGESGWADRHDEYLAEIYLENHADSK